MHAWWCGGHLLTFLVVELKEAQLALEKGSGWVFNEHIIWGKC